jgi:hypothetical protein
VELTLAAQASARAGKRPEVEAMLRAAELLEEALKYTTPHGEVMRGNLDDEGRS